MFFGLLEWSLRIMLATAILLLLAWLLWFLFDGLMSILRGPQISYLDTAFLAAIVSVGSWGVSLIHRPIAKASQP